MGPESGGEDGSESDGRAGMTRDVIEVHGVLVHPSGNIITRKMVEVKIEPTALWGTGVFSGESGLTFCALDNGRRAGEPERT